MSSKISSSNQAINNILYGGANFVPIAVPRFCFKVFSIKVKILFLRTTSASSTSVEVVTSFSCLKSSHLRRADRPSSCGMLGYKPTTSTVSYLQFFKLDFMIGKYLIFIGFSKALEFLFTRIKDHIIVIEPVLYYFKIFVQIFLNQAEISAIRVQSIISSVVTHTASSQEAENVINENIIKVSGLNIESCGTPL